MVLTADSRQAFLQPCGLIDSDSQAVAAAVAEATKGCSNDQERAIGIYNFVRDKILFGFSPEFDQLPASKVLRDRKGFCNPKSTLFVAMLRAAGIPARQHMVSINMNVLTGLGTPTAVYGDHAISEVFLGGRWLLVDSYTVDSALYKAGMVKLQQQGLKMGYGVHVDGVNAWDGKSDSFVQYVMPSGIGTSAGAGSESAFSGAAATPDGPASDADFGVVADLRQFCKQVKGSPFAGLRTWLGYAAFALVGSRYCNSLIRQLRSSV